MVKMAPHSITIFDFIGSVKSEMISKEQLGYQLHDKMRIRFPSVLHINLPENFTFHVSLTQTMHIEKGTRTTTREQ